MSSFARLMALSAQHTKESAAESQTLIAERQKKEQQKRQAQEEKERKEREMQAEFRRKQFERERLERERRQKAEEARRKLLEEQEEKRRTALLYGPKAAGGSKPRGAVTHHGSRGGSDDSDGGGMALTREEKRQRKLQAELNRSSTPRRTTSSKHGRRLAGGAINITTESETLAATLTATSSPSQSIKQRIAALPITLQQLNKVKRDVRTIDEILQDRAKEKESKVLDGDQARGFHDWFSTKPKKNDPASKLSNSAAASVSPSPSRSHTPLPPSQTRSTTSGGNSPAAAPRPLTQSKQPSLSTSNRNSFLSKATPQNSDSKATASRIPGKANLIQTSKMGKDTTTHRGRSSSIKDNATSSQAPRKRPRSPSISPPPKKRASYSGSSLGGGFSEEIWKMFGKDRGAYMSRDVYSDDEDMEADAEAVRREELRSARIAKQEDDKALEDERRREEEKRKRKKELLKEKKGY